MSLVGCSRSTAKNMLYHLVKEGKVNKIEIEVAVTVGRN
jgi:hypothetical protein